MNELQIISMLINKKDTVVDIAIHYFDVNILRNQNRPIFQLLTLFGQYTLNSNKARFLIFRYLSVYKSSTSFKHAKK